MKIRKARATHAASQSALASPPSPRIEAVLFEAPASLVTLEDPGSDPEPARNAFARLRPPEGHPPGETASWAGVVRAIARAVRVVPQPRRRGLPRPEEGPRSPAAGIREEATALAAATKDAGVIALTEQILSEVEGGA